MSENYSQLLDLMGFNSLKMFSKVKRFNEKKLLLTAGFEPGLPDLKTDALPTRLPRHLIKC